MIAWLLTEVNIYRFEFIGYYILILIFGIVGTIGWIELSQLIAPMKLKKYLSIMLRGIMYDWASFKKVKKYDVVSYPQEEAKESKKTPHPFPPDKLRPVNTPNMPSDRRAPNEHYKSDKPVNKPSFHNDIIGRGIHKVNPNREVPKSIDTHIFKIRVV